MYVEPSNLGMFSLREEQFWLLVLYRKVPGQLDLDSAEPRERTASLPSAVAAAGFDWSHLLSRQAGCSQGEFALQESLSVFQCVNPNWPTLNSSCFCKTPTQFLMIFKKPGAFKARNKPIRLLAVLAFLLPTALGSCCFPCTRAHQMQQAGPAGCR